MSSSSTIHAIEGVIRSQLRSLGYHNIKIEKEQDKTFNVIADGTLRNIFLKVLIKLVSEQFQDLSTAEISKIKEEAQQVQKEPWTAVLMVNEQGQLIDRIRWTNLNKHYA
jgi:hypothetical protein